MKTTISNDVLSAAVAAVHPDVSVKGDKPGAARQIQQAASRRTSFGYGTGCRAGINHGK